MSFLAEEPETEALTSGVDILNECESTQKLDSEGYDLNSCSISSTTDFEDKRYYLKSCIYIDDDDDVYICNYTWILTTRNVRKSNLFFLNYMYKATITLLVFEEFRAMLTPDIF